MDKSIKKEVWYISKYAVHPEIGPPTRQYFFSRYFSKKNRNVTLISSRSNLLYNYPQFKFKQSINHYYGSLNCVLLNGPKINLGFSLKRIWSWILFEFQLLLWVFLKKKPKPDVIIVSSLSLLTFLSGILLKRYYKCKLVCEVRDIWPLTIIESKKFSKKNIFIKFLSYIEQLGYNNADAVIGTMPNLKGHVNNVSRGNIHKIFHIPMGFDPDFYENNNQSDKKPWDEIFRKIKDEGNFIVGYAGTLGATNCLNQIIEAASLLKSKPVKFMILGNGPLKEELKDIAEKLLLSNVFFFDAVKKEEVILFLKANDLLLNPWRGEGKLYEYGVSPNKWIDYMYSARPILVSFNGHQSIINEAKCGRFIEADNAELLAETILEFSTMSKEKLDEMGLRGKDYLINKMNYNHISDKYLEIIDAL